MKGHKSSCQQNSFILWANWQKKFLDFHHWSVQAYFILLLTYLLSNTEYSVNLQWGWWPQNVFLISEKWKSIHKHVYVLLHESFKNLHYNLLKNDWCDTHLLQLITRNSFLIYSKMADYTILLISCWKSMNLSLLL